mgnify:CR=1 FL=1
MNNWSVVYWDGEKVVTEGGNYPEALAYGLRSEYIQGGYKDCVIVNSVDVLDAIDAMQKRYPVRHGGLTNEEAADLWKRAVDIVAGEPIIAYQVQDYNWVLEHLVKNTEDERTKARVAVCGRQPLKAGEEIQFISKKCWQMVVNYIMAD